MFCTVFIPKSTYWSLRLSNTLQYVRVKTFDRGSQLKSLPAKMEMNPLELALQQLAKTMGVSIPSGPAADENIKIQENVSNVSSSKADVEEEEGEVMDDIPSPVKQKPRDVKKNAKKTDNRDNNKKVVDYNGDVDAESLLRGGSKPAVKNNKRKPEPKREQRPPPVPKTPVEAKRPKVPCRYWMEGKCGKGDNCTFSHAMKPNKTVEEAKSIEVCKYHIAGNCLKGESCMFSHDLGLVPCRFFHVKGECGAGKTCRFSHEPIGEEERRLLFAEMMGARDPRLASTSAPSKPIIAPLPVLPTPAPVNAERLPILDAAVEKFNPFGSPF